MTGARRTDGLSTRVRPPGLYLPRSVIAGAVLLSGLLGWLASPASADIASACRGNHSLACSEIQYTPYKQYISGYVWYWRYEVGAGRNYPNSTNNYSGCGGNLNTTAQMTRYTNTGVWVNWGSQGTSSTGSAWAIFSPFSVNNGGTYTAAKVTGTVQAKAPGDVNCQSSAAWVQVVGP